jgi:hypothetical protein
LIGAHHALWAVLQEDAHKKNNGRENETHR